MKEVIQWDITWGSLFRIAVAVGLVVLLTQASEAIMVFFVGIVVSLGVSPFVSSLERLGVNRLLASFLVFLLTALCFFSIVYFVVPIVIGEAGSFVKHLMESLPAFGIAVPEIRPEDVRGWLSNALGMLGAANISLTGAIGTIFSKVVLFISAIMVSFYLTVEKDGVERLIRGVLPKAYEETALGIFGHFREKIRRWFGAQLWLSLLMGILTGVGMWILGVPYPLVLGILAAVFEVVPVIGPIITGAVALLVAVGGSPTLAVYAIIFFMILQQVENHLLIPLIMGKSVEVHPVAVILALLVGGTVAGLVGILLAVPFAVLVKEVLEHIAEQKRRQPGHLGV
ncbi:MAG: AI-2E family transporter [bacterium]|nr:AI-2E family transporter [bacterium]